MALFHDHQLNVQVGKENAPPKSKVVEEFDIEVDGSIAGELSTLATGA
jgi:hypothetical protein